MKALVLAAAVIAALSSSTPAGAAREARQPIVDTTTAAVIADAGRLGSASLTSLNGSAHWTPATTRPAAETEFDALPVQVETGTLLIGLGAVALALARPVSRALRRQEQQRRATALASAIAHSPRG
ncbi:hypothetical protein J2X20_002217 [Pelomonas saccharophila]|uniref:PEP-CTERM protein-sorting domain-containing protein n=1 Tax=Roseateles saccharophilus TaxID=304 RepID=A0ABU1YL50_ROSSA|nr:hypothetical protein [Roseateles saccharophilus]MDR7269588.1 hypothetical protein [Roseateles saccharophilus]